MVLRVTTAFAETGPQTFKNVVRSLEASFAEMPPGSRDIRCSKITSPLVPRADGLPSPIKRVAWNEGL